MGEASGHAAYRQFQRLPAASALAVAPLIRDDFNLPAATLNPALFRVTNRNPTPFKKGGEISCDEGPVRLDIDEVPKAHDFWALGRTKDPTKGGKLVGHADEPIRGRLQLYATERLHAFDHVRR